MNNRNIKKHNCLDPEQGGPLRRGGREWLSTTTLLFLAGLLMGATVGTMVCRLNPNWSNLLESFKNCGCSDTSVMSFVGGVVIGASLGVLLSVMVTEGSLQSGPPRPIPDITVSSPLAPKASRASKKIKSSSKETL